MNNSKTQSWKTLEVEKEGRVVLKGRGTGETEIPDIEGTHIMPWEEQLLCHPCQHHGVFL